MVAKSTAFLEFLAVALIFDPLTDNAPVDALVLGLHPEHREAVLVVPHPMVSKCKSPLW